MKTQKIRQSAPAAEHTANGNAYNAHKEDTVPMDIVITGTIAIGPGNPINSSIASLRTSLEGQGLEIRPAGIVAAASPANRSTVNFIPFADAGACRIAWIIAITNGEEIGAIHQIGPIPSHRMGIKADIAIPQEEDIFRAVANCEAEIGMVPRIADMIEAIIGTTIGIKTAKSDSIIGASSLGPVCAS